MAAFLENWQNNLQKRGKNGLDGFRFWESPSLWWPGS
jgi:hypothetical protein